MVELLQQWVPSDVCLACDGCCRFKEADSIWRPKISAQEKARGLAEKIFSLEHIDAGGALTTKACHGMHVCTFFNPNDHTCQVYRARPFECELYPFIISRHDRKPALYVHLNCPYIQQYRSTPRFDEYAEYLKQYFCRSDVINFLKHDSALIADYASFRNELEYLFALDLA